VREQLIAKLHPDQFSEMSGKMAAVVAYILEERWTEPAIAELVVTADGLVLAHREDDPSAPEIIGQESDLDRNLMSLIEAAGLTQEEVADFGRRQRKRISRHRS
jgi:hypothetical protein